jgi:LacI family transcriptional regulator
MNRPPQVALIVETSVIYGRRILSGIARYLRSHHRWSVFLEQHELGARPPAWLFSGQWDGVLSRPTDPDLARLLRRLKIPVVDLNDLHDNLGLCWVGSDHAGIGRIGAAHLLERGYRRFAFCGFSGELWATRRLDGFRAAIAERGFTVSVYESPWRGPSAPRWDKDMDDIVTWLKGLPLPAAIMACNDVRGRHVLDACERAGVLVPEELAVVGVDNEEILCELCNAPLSSVEPDAERIGYEAAELLDSLMAGKAPPRKRISIAPRQVVARHSTEVFAAEDRLVATAMRFIREQAVHGCSVASVLKHVNASRSLLERRFRRFLERSPQMEIRVVQISRVKELLTQTDYTLARIAELSGFKHPEYMSVMFKRLGGMTPGQYRKQHRA